VAEEFVNPDSEGVGALGEIPVAVIDPGRLLVAGCRRRLCSGCFWRGGLSIFRLSQLVASGPLVTG
jgi:hypothetical protein